MNGIVERFNMRRGFGFIRPMAGGGPDAAPIYFHISAVCRPEKGYLPALPNGCEVKFDLVRSDKGPQCANVRLVKLSGALVAPPLPIEEQLARFRNRSKATRARSRENVV